MTAWWTQTPETDFFAGEGRAQMLTHRPLLDVERLGRRLERRIYFEEMLREIMEDAPLKADGEVVRRPKVKRRAPMAGPITERKAA